MEDELLLEVIGAVREVNIILQEMEVEEDDEFIAEYDFCPYLGIRGNDFFIEVRYLSFQIWRSDEDDRKEIEAGTETSDPVYEPMAGFLKRKVNLINKTIGKIRV